MPRVPSVKSSNECTVCHTVIAHRHDMGRHMRIHDIGTEQKKYKCSWDQCSFESRQKSNFNTHYRTHLKDKSKACPECDFRTCDPSSLTRHRKRLHGYLPKPRKARSTKVQASGECTHLELSVSSSTVPSSTSPKLEQDTESIAEPLSPLPYAFPLEMPDFLPMSSAPICFEEEPESYWASLLCSPEPRPLFPGVESTPPLETLYRVPPYVAYSPLTFTFPVDGHGASQRIDSSAFYFPPSLVLSEPTPAHDFVRERTESVGSSIPTTVSKQDFQSIFGGDYRQSLVAPMSPFSGSSTSASSETVSPAVSPSSPSTPGSLLEELNTSHPLF